MEEIKEKICKPLKLDDKTCDLLRKNILECFEFTEKTGKECGVYLTKKGVIKITGRYGEVFPPGDIGYSFDFHMHPKLGAVEFSLPDKVSFTIKKPKMACVGGWEDEKKTILCIQRLSEEYPFKCEQELSGKIWGKIHKIEEKYKPLIEKVQKELDTVIDEITKIPPSEKKGELYRKLNEKRLKLLKERKKLIDKKWKEISPLKFELEKVKEICQKRYPILKIKFQINAT